MCSNNVRPQASKMETVQTMAPALTVSTWLTIPPANIYCVLTLCQTLHKVLYEHYSHDQKNLDCPSIEEQLKQ